MDLSSTLSVVQTILTAIQTLGQLQSIFSGSSSRAELSDLQNTVEKARAVLEDADARQDSLSSLEKNYVQELKDAVYDADDVLDEFLTLAKQQQLREDKDEIFDKVKSFFFRFKHLTHNLPSKVKTVNQKFGTIATTTNMFSFKVDYKPMKFTKEETSSFLSDDIIGRDKDLETIVDVLLGSNTLDYPNVSFLAITGMGGLGKTAFAKLVYNDPRISDAFQLKKWTCIADQDQQQWSLKGFLGKVIVEGSSLSIDDKTSLEQIHHEVKRQLGGKKYLLILDDVWTESYNEWQQLEGFLKVGGRGSWIIITTRSKITAEMIGGDRVHVLEGLSELDSWRLFERMAFQAEERDDELVKLGREIVKKCTNVPLVIRVVGSLLRGQSKYKWLSFHDKGLDDLSESNDTMTRVLKLSYDQLNSSLKSCFAYCAIFPKDWLINKETLIRLWMAQGYINSENLGEEYLLILLQRCFFQDIQKDDFGEIMSFKIHDLLHDIAEKVAGEEICKFSFDTSNVGKRVRHLSLVSASYPQHIFNNTHIRTCHFAIDEWKLRPDQLLASKLIQKWTCLRSLDLRRSSARNLPESIDDVSKLVDLSTLDIGQCEELSCMPTGIGMLTCLHTLRQFVVGVRPSSTSKLCFYGLENLQHLNKLKGRLKIQLAVLKNSKFVKEEHGGGGYLKSKEHLKTIVFRFRRGAKYGNKESEQALLQEMQPHREIKTLELNGYHGETIPIWPGSGDNSALFDLPNLVTLKIQDCSELVYLPWQFGMLPHLKTLCISGLSNMEYVADSETPVSGEGSSFFPSLDKLSIHELPRLKGWWRRSESGSHVVNPDESASNREAHVKWVSSPCFSLLKHLTIKYCEKMMCVLSCPQLEHLEIYASRKDMRSTPRHQSLVSYPKLKKLKTNNLEWLKSMPIKSSQFLVKIVIREEERIESLEEVTELFPTSFLSSLRFLAIRRCMKLKSVEGWLEHLSTLEYLRIEDCPKVVLGGVSWHNLAGTLNSLRLSGLKEMEELPQKINNFIFCERYFLGIQYCISLRYLNVSSCPKLKSVPKWMPKLTSLRVLYLWGCSESLKERWQQPNGEDWHLIQHISNVSVW